MLTITNEDNMALMARYPDKHFDLAIVDPPYGINMDGGNIGGSVLAKTTAYTKKDWDKFAPDLIYFNELVRVSKNQIIWGANHFIENIPNSNTPSWIVWDKQNGDNNFADCELAWTSFKSAVRKFEFRWAGMLQGDMKNKESRIHPTQKPAALYKFILDKYAKPNDKILDTHLGSGSIAIACHDYGFDLTACELDKEYFDKAMQRINNHTNQVKLF
jgi:site-specific DNA-methyltransferase (adenine-specific)